MERKHTKARKLRKRYFIFFCNASVTGDWRRWGRLAEATVPGKNHLRTARRAVPTIRH